MPLTPETGFYPFRLASRTHLGNEKVPYIVKTPSFEVPGIGRGRVEIVPIPREDPPQAPVAIFEPDQNTIYTARLRNSDLPYYGLIKVVLFNLDEPEWVYPNAISHLFSRSINVRSEDLRFVGNLDRPEYYYGVYSGPGIQHKPVVIQPYNTRALRSLGLQIEHPTVA